MDAAPHKIGLNRLPLRAAAFVALVCVVIVASSGWTEWASREIDLKNAQVELGNLARSLTQHAEDTVELADGILSGIVSRLETEGANPAVVAQLQAVLNMRKPDLGRIRGLFVFDEDGRWFATTETVNLTGLDNSDRDYFRHHRESVDPGIFIGKPIHSRSGGHWVTTLSRRWNHADGTFGGVAVATIDASYFSDFYSQFDMSTHGTIALLRGDGITLARYPDNAANVGRDISDAAFLKGVHSRAYFGAYFFRSAEDGRERLAIYHRSNRYPLSVLVTKAESDVLAQWRHDARTRVGLVLGLVVLIAVIGAFLVRQLLQGRRMAAALADKEASFRLLAEGSSDMVTRVGRDERIQYVSPSSARITGWSPDQLVGTPALARVNPKDLPHVEEALAALRRGEAEETRITYRTRHREESDIWVESTLRVTRKVSGEGDGVVAITRDVTHQKNLEERLAVLATEDGLTGLANRRSFDERLEEEWGRACRESTCLALLMIDIDHFKRFNDEYGHPAGDECLRSVARILAAEAQRSTDLAARYGGEEFAMLMPNMDAAGCERVGERIRRKIRDAGMRHALNLPSGLVTASLGGAICRPVTDRSAGCASLVEAADRALYAAKDGGRDRLVMAGQVVGLFPRTSAAG
jgi:diguanylate cyclase (GGDEF)-like protein/PAS domain S-box-containing protein